MAGNSIGEIFRVTTFGESHGKAIGLVIDGCPAGMKLNTAFIQKQLNKRKPGQSHITSQRKESDQFELLSGIYNGITLGGPLAFIIRNEDAKPADYDHLKTAFRPSHADFTYFKKYGIHDIHGGGRSSARETAARVIAGAVAMQVLQKQKIYFHTYVSQVGNIKTEEAIESMDFLNIEKTPVRCPDLKAAKRMIRFIEEIRKEGDTIGGVVSCLIRGVPAGLGEPVFDKLQADLAKAMMSINAAHGFDYGAGFESVIMKGSEHNDVFVKKGKKISTLTNNSGGIQGGISNGQDLFFRVAFKPVSTIMKKQQSVDHTGKKILLTNKGRHDPCVVPRAVPIVESMAAIILVDHYLRNKTILY
jgi:chorismate synthase